MKQTFIAPDWLLTRRLRVLLVGCGGTGSHLADGLASLNVTLVKLGHPGFDVTLADHDRVSPHNLGRQRFAAPDVGHNKALLLQHRINLFYGLDWNAHPHRVSPGEASRLDVLITATDSALFRAAVGKHFRRRATHALWLDHGNGASTGQVILGHLSGTSSTDGLRLPNVFDLYPELADMAAADREAPSCSTEEAIQRQEWPINRAMAQAGLTILWNLFRAGELQSHGALVDTRSLHVSPMPIDPEAWAFWGYAQSTRKKRTRKAA